MTTDGGAVEPEYVVTVKRWPAFMLGGLLPILMGLSAIQVAFVAGQASISSPLSIVASAVVVISSLAVLAVLTWSLMRTVTVIRRPPRLTARGMRLWLLPTSEYVFVPWSQITAVRAATKGIGTGLFVYVAYPDGLADGDPAKERKIRRFVRRYLGAPFVYPVSDSTLDGLDHAVRGYSAGHYALRRG